MSPKRSGKSTSRHRAHAKSDVNRGLLEGFQHDLDDPPPTSYIRQSHVGRSSQPSRERERGQSGHRGSKHHRQEGRESRPRHDDPSRHRSRRHQSSNRTGQHLVMPSPLGDQADSVLNRVFPPSSETLSQQSVGNIPETALGLTFHPGAERAAHIHRPSEGDVRSARVTIQPAPFADSHRSHRRESALHTPTDPGGRFQSLSPPTTPTRPVSLSPPPRRPGPTYGNAMPPVEFRREFPLTSHDPTALPAHDHQPI